MDSLTSNLHQSLQTFQSLHHELRDILQAVERGHGSLAVIPKLSSTLLRLKQTHRELQTWTQDSESVLRTRKQAVDELHLEYQSALYEKSFLLRESAELRRRFTTAGKSSVAGKEKEKEKEKENGKEIGDGAEDDDDDDDELLPESEFLQLHRSRATPAESRLPEHLPKDPHQLHLLRLAHEMELRRTAASELQSLQARKRKLGSELRIRASKLRRTRTQVQDLLQESRKVQETLALSPLQIPDPGAATEGLGVGGAGLPGVLHGLYSSARVYESLWDSEQTSSSSSSSPSSSSASDSGSVFLTTLPELKTELSRRAQLQSRQQQTEEEEDPASGFGDLLELDPNSVLLTFRFRAADASISDPSSSSSDDASSGDASELRLRFSYLPKLQTILVKTEPVEAPQQQQQRQKQKQKRRKKNGSEFDLLTNLYPLDTGMELPHDITLILTSPPTVSVSSAVGRTASSHGLHSAVLSLEAGKPYRWAQELCGLHPKTLPQSVGAAWDQLPTPRTAERGLLEFSLRLQDRIQNVTAFQSTLKHLEQTHPPPPPSPAVSFPTPAFLTSLERDTGRPRPNTRITAWTPAGGAGGDDDDDADGPSAEFLKFLRRFDPETLLHHHQQRTASGDASPASPPAAADDEPMMVRMKTTEEEERSSSSSSRSPGQGTRIPRFLSHAQFFRATLTTEQQQPPQPPQPPSTAAAAASAASAGTGAGTALPTLRWKMEFAVFPSAAAAAPTTPARPQRNTSPAILFFFLSELSGLPEEDIQTAHESSESRAFRESFSSPSSSSSPASTPLSWRTEITNLLQTVLQRLQPFPRLHSPGWGFPALETELYRILDLCDHFQSLLRTAFHQPPGNFETLLSLKDLHSEFQVRLDSLKPSSVAAATEEDPMMIASGNEEEKEKEGEKMEID